SAALAVLSIVAAIYLVNARVTLDAERTLHRELDSTAAQFEKLRATRTDTYTLMARFIADEPHLKAALDTNHPDTVEDAARNFEDQLKSNLFLVTNRAGQVLAQFGTTERAALVIATQPAIHDALAGREGISLLPQPDGVLQLVTVPMLVEPRIQ